MTSDALATELTAALKRRIAVIGDREMRERDPAGQLAELQRVSEEIVRLQGELPAGAHPQLRHFFERCSYDKALAWIEAEGLGD